MRDLNLLRGEELKAKIKARESFYSNWKQTTAEEETSLIKLKYELYIGSDNTTNTINKTYLETCIKTLDGAFNEGYSIEYLRGRFKGINEDTIRVIIFSDRVISNIDSITQELRTALKQEEIILTTQEIEFKKIKGGLKND